MRLLTLFCTTLLLSWSGASATLTPEVFTPATTPVALPVGVQPLPPNTPVFTLNQLQLQSLRASLADGGRTQIAIELAKGNTVIADVSRFFVFSKTARLTAVGKGQAVPIQKPQSLLLRGTIAGMPSSHVMLALYPNNAFGRIEYGNQSFELCTLPTDIQGDKHSQTHDSQHYAFVESTHLQKPQEWNCLAQEDERPRIVPDRKSKSNEKVQGSGYTVQVALEGDYDYYLDNGSDNTTATNYAEAVIAAASDIYKRDVKSSLSIDSWTLWTAADPYTGTSASAILGQFKSYWQSNNDGVSRTIAHIFSGINGIGGVAYLDGLCNKGKGYSVAGLNSTYTYPNANYTWDVDVASHEIGHNVGSPHTHSCTWNPPIDSCYTSEGGCFAQTVATKGTIMSYCHLTNKGTQLKFHDRVIDLMQQYLDDAECMPQGASLTVNAGQDVTVCGGTTVDFEGSVAGGVEPYEITWTPNDGMTGVNTYTPSVVATTTTSYVMTVMDADSTFASDTVVVTVNPQITLTAPDTLDVCKGSAVTVSVTVNGGSGLKTYTWNINGVETNTSVNSYTFTPAANTTVGLLVTDTKDCNATETIYVRVNNVPKLTLTGPTAILCANDNSALKAKIVGGTPPYSYSWSSKDGVFSSQPDSVIVSPDSNQSYNLRITDAKGCTDTAIVSLSVHNIKMGLSTDKLLLANLGACQTVENVWITVINKGDIPFTIETVKAKYTTVTSKDFPVTIPPNSTHLLPLQLTLPNVSPILDTLIFAETVCKQPFLVELSGVRGGITAVQSNNPAGGPTLPACKQQTPVTVTVSVDNKATKAATIISAKTTSGAKATVIGAPVVIGSQNKGSVQITFGTAINAGDNVDTAFITYSSEECTATISTPVHFNGVGVAMTMADTIVFTDPVSPALEDVTKQFEITPSYQGLSSVTIGQVVVTGPFSTTLAAGTPLESDKPLATTVTLHPVQMTADSVATGTLSFTTGDCSDAYTVTLEAKLTIVSVTENSDAEAPRCWLQANEVHTYPESIAVTVYDLTGNIVAQRISGSSSIINLEQYASGLYVAVLETGHLVTVPVPLLLTR